MINKNVDLVKKRQFIIIMFIWMLASWLFLLNGKGLFSDYFIEGLLFSDLYSPMAKEIGNTYEAPFFSNYPPLANLFFVLLRNITKVEVDGQLVSVNSRFYICAIVFFAISIIMLFAVMVKRLNLEEKKVINCFVTITFLLSGPFLFLYTRGNILIFVIVLVTYFLFNYNSEQAWKRNLSMICIAVSSALKIYPIIYMLLYVKNKKWKELIITSIMTIALYIIPFAVYGMESIELFVKNIFFRDGTINNVLNHTISLKGSIKMLQGATTLHIGEVSNLILLIAFLALMYMLFTSRHEWMQDMTLSMLVIWMFNGSYLYNVCFLTAPIVLFLDYKKKRKSDIIYIILFNIIFSTNFFEEMYRLNRILPIYNLGRVSWNILITQIGLLVLVIMMFVDNLIERRREIENNVI